ncbi:MAG: hypothetical protein H0W70_03165, partial [Actinobacteria bacterium]|nr:hypothetical protein [Actinomycetota bacterium]
MFLAVAATVMTAATGARADTVGSPDTTTKAAVAPAAANLDPGATLAGATEGTTINVHVDGTAGKVFSASARLCKSGLDVQTTSQLSPTQFGNCVATPFLTGSDDAFKSQNADTAKQNVDFSVRLGTGTQTFRANNGDSTITCDATHPCALWIDESVDRSLTPGDDSGHIFKHYEVQYDGSTAPFHPLTPARILDTRSDQTSVVDDFNAPLGPN